MLINSRFDNPLVGYLYDAKFQHELRIRSEDLIISASLTQDFCLYSRRINRRIAGYATVYTTQKTDKKTSQDSDIIESSFLRVELSILITSVERYLLY